MHHPLPPGPKTPPHTASHTNPLPHKIHARPTTPPAPLQHSPNTQSKQIQQKTQKNPATQPDNRRYKPEYPPIRIGIHPDTYRITRRHVSAHTPARIGRITTNHPNFITRRCTPSQQQCQSPPTPYPNHPPKTIARQRPSP
ncbi:MAG: hypothetical protein LBH04_05695 [Tannerellaceae bacterium]|nr:hypothetical protein [Tannerellaceae bacterium]